MLIDYDGLLALDGMRVVEPLSSGVGTRHTGFLVFTNTWCFGGQSQLICVGTLDLASVSPNVRSVSDSVRSRRLMFSSIVRRKLPHFDCAPLQVVSGGLADFEGNAPVDHAWKRMPEFSAVWAYTPRTRFRATGAAEAELGHLFSAREAWTVAKPGPRAPSRFEHQGRPPTPSQVPSSARA